MCPPESTQGKANNNTNIAHSQKLNLSTLSSGELKSKTNAKASQ